ncbi:MAG: 2Fe-2S iron-sulfur cluster-binding protein [Hyphomicrobiaceae bacterium]|nr:2Fe-2S iron-sulfur cluster-binding protein [Hyphomicrobiaceae bacterium]
MTRITLTVNGEKIERDVTPRTNLADFLREDLALTGTHVGCEHGICGACTVVIDGQIARSCITYAVTCDGAGVRTIEDFDDDPLMEKLRHAFSAEHALQCGYCTPGMLVAARDLIRRGSAGDEDAIRTGMSGNLCRCTGYVGIVKAIATVAGDHDVSREEISQADVLGPAPGPAAHDSLQNIQRDAVPPAAEKRRKERVAAPTLASPSDANVQTGEITQDGSFTKLTQTITVNHPRNAVWDLMADIEKVATCMPGVSLDGPVESNHVDGRMLVKLGPINADLKGEADIIRDPENWRGVIDGKGRDARSASLARGRVEYELAETDEGNGTLIAVSIAYSLAGPLAQFSRGAIVRDLVTRLASAFAQNLEARLEGREPDQDAQALDAGSLVFSVLWDRIRSYFARLLGRKPG